MITIPTLNINLDAVQDNYCELQKHTSGQEICPVIKSNAYGLGATNFAKTLMDCGCNTFYVSTAKEGMELREEIQNIQINVLNGPLKGTLPLFKEFQLTPVINSMNQLNLWETTSHDETIHPILNLETGFNRLGIPQKDWEKISPERLKKNNFGFIMTHLSCGGEDTSNPKMHQQNINQFNAYQKALDYFKLPGSLGLDAHMVNTGYPIHQIRSGAALTGVNVFPNKFHLKNVFTLKAPVLQIETVKAGENVGYGATYSPSEDTKIAVLGIGYSNGIPRTLSGKEKSKGKVWFTDGETYYSAPIVGRISMGLLTCDVGNIPQKVLDLEQASLINDHYTINEFCQDAEKLDTEIMCNFHDLRPEYTYSKKKEFFLSKQTEKKKAENKR